MKRFKNCFCIRETEKAILVLDADENQTWIPKSQVHDDSEVYGEDHEGDLVVTDWMADRLNWVEP